MPPLLSVRYIVVGGIETEFCRIFSEFQFSASPLKNADVPKNEKSED